MQPPKLSGSMLNFVAASIVCLVRWQVPALRVERSGLELRVNYGRVDSSGTRPPAHAATVHITKLVI